MPSGSALDLPDMSLPHLAPVLRRAFRVVSPSCEDMTALFSAALDRKLPLRTRLRMRVHLLYCVYCRRARRHFEVLRTIAPALDEHPAADAEHSLGAASRERLRQALRKDSSQPGD